MNLGNKYRDVLLCLGLSHDTVQPQLIEMLQTMKIASEWVFGDVVVGQDHQLAVLGTALEAVLRDSKTKKCIAQKMT